MVMGVQRSGTTALFRSLAHDPALTAFHESPDDAIYYLYRLRPMREIAPIFDATPGAILLKPINETFDRSLEDLRKEYRNYALKIVWIYRDPVNVLVSMSRKGWLPTDLAGEPGAGNWVARNRLALQFQKSHPDLIVVVRYEDLIADRNIFRSLCESLGVNGMPVFRPDRGTGRRDLSPSSQRAIDVVTGPTLRVLDAARSFRPGPVYRLRSAAAAGLARLPSKRRAPAATLPSPDEWAEKIAAAEPIRPSAVDGLLFWLNASRVTPLEGRVGDIKESGPFHFCARTDGQPPFCIPFLNGRPALFFPTTKAPERLHGDRGLLRFVASEKEAFLPLHRSFAGLALIKPHVPIKLNPDQERVIALRLRSEDDKITFSVEWDRGLRASLITLRTQNGQCSVASVPGSHPHQHWRMVHFQLLMENPPQIAISVDGNASATQVTFAAIAPDPATEWVIQLGGCETEPAALFYGAIAEVMLFSRALTAGEQLALGKYMKEKYRL